jgi:hypothetical protein
MNVDISRSIPALFLVLLGTLANRNVHSQEVDCTSMQYRDFSTGMCSPLAMASMPMRMLMIHGNVFGAQSFLEGRRGQNAFAAPNMLMADLGSSVGARHYLNVDLMLTAEKWTLPTRGYPELLQIGEHDENGDAFIDAQHPHSSPLMGLTLSDTISLGARHDHLKLFFAPRGQSGDGPVAFMHRATSAYNPDAPLGHHIGQDVGHISSTVVGASLNVASTTLELSTFNGKEPEPTRVDLPMGKPDSWSARVIQEFSDRVQGMASIAHVASPEPDEPSLKNLDRYSASLYSRYALSDSGWLLHNAFILGLITHFDQASSLSSINEEWLLTRNGSRIWGRYEILQRTPAELGMSELARPNSARWVHAFTVGYNHRLAAFSDMGLSAGASITKDFLPSEYRPSYSGNPLSARVYLQLGGMKMWDL